MLKFYKYNGIGNDFVVIDNRNKSVKLDSNDIVKICDRRFGIGADGIVLLEESNIADYKMIIYNSDGTNPSMCGNAIRCFGKYLFNKGICKKSDIFVETQSGIFQLEVKIYQDKIKSVRVNMGVPVFESSRIPVKIPQKEAVEYLVDINSKSYKLTSLLMGVPHTVVFTENISDNIVIEEGKLIEKTACFPFGTNVNLVKVLNRNEIIIRTWERGAGYTYACGTGACASVAAGIKSGKLNDKVLVHLRGGDLNIDWEDRLDIYMEGSAEEVYSGVIENLILQYKSGRMLNNDK